MAKKSLLKDFKSGKQHKKNKQQQQNTAPETADEFLAAGVELEEGGEKWRVGDPVKGMRFYMRAIEMYDNGLKRYPNAFDLAYNKARTQYEITQHPKLSKQLPAPLVDVLNAALQSHRAALVLNQESIDALFNTAQVLTSLAEALTDDGRSIASRATTDGNQINEAVQHLLEALDLFQRCRTLQELQVNQNEEELAEAKKRFEEEANAPRDETQSQGPIVQDNGAPSATDTNAGDEQWAMVVEPITRDSLIDTAIAQLQALATLCGLLTAAGYSQVLTWAEEYGFGLMNDKLPLYTQEASPERLKEVTLARTAFLASLAEASYRVRKHGFMAYKDELSNALALLDQFSSDPDALVVKAEANISFSTAVGETEQRDPIEQTDVYRRAQQARWQKLSDALDALTTVSKLPTTEQQRLPRIHIARGDTEMFRWRLGAAPWSHPLAIEYGARLLNNAQAYYRGAAAIARQHAMHGAVNALDYEAEGLSKEAIAAALEGNVQKLANLLARNKAEVMRRAEEMVEDGLADAEDIRRVWQLVDPTVIVRMEP